MLDLDGGAEKLPAAFRKYLTLRRVGVVAEKAQRELTAGKPVRRQSAVPIKRDVHFADQATDEVRTELGVVIKEANAGASRARLPDIR